MRITAGQMAQTTIRNIQRNLERMERTQDQITSGRRITKPSDDPIGTTQALMLRTQIAEMDQQARNIDSGLTWLTAADISLAGLGDVLGRARELALRGANSTLDATDRATLASEVEQLIHQAVTIGNAANGGQSLFAGFQTRSAPFQAVGSPVTAVTYSGDSGQIAREVGRGTTIVVNVPGDVVFNPAFAALIDLQNRLRANDPVGAGQAVTGLDGALENVLETRAVLGAKTSHLEVAQERLAGLKLNLQKLLSTREDLDLAEAVTRFSTEETVYRASLAAAGKALPPSLLDYLR